MLRSLLYCAASTAVAAAVTLLAYRERHGQFYQASIVLSNSAAAWLILLNFALSVTYLAYDAWRWIFFGQLRALEVERLNERIWFAITESILAMAMFRDSFDGVFMAMFVVLIIGKIFHWLAEDRVEFIGLGLDLDAVAVGGGARDGVNVQDADAIADAIARAEHLAVGGGGIGVGGGGANQADQLNNGGGIGQIFIVRWMKSLIDLWIQCRLYVVLPVLAFHDFIELMYAATSVSVSGSGIMIVFAFEYGILLVTMCATICKAAVMVYAARVESKRVQQSLENFNRDMAEALNDPDGNPGDVQMEDADPWEHKTISLAIIDIIAEFFKAAAYIVFFAVIVSNYGLPIHIIRDLYVSLKSFVTKILDVIRFRQAEKAMKERYTDVLADEMNQLRDRTCIICREEMQPAVNIEDGDGDGDQGRNGAEHNANEKKKKKNASRVPKRLPCGHIFHYRCLHGWLERQQSCPTCRRSVFEPTPTQPQTTTPPPQQQPPQHQQQQHAQPAVDQPLPAAVDAADANELQPLLHPLPRMIPRDAPHAAVDDQTEEDDIQTATNIASATAGDHQDGVHDTLADVLANHYRMHLPHRQCVSATHGANASQFGHSHSGIRLIPVADITNGMQIADNDPMKPFLQFLQEQHRSKQSQQSQQSQQQSQQSQQSQQGPSNQELYEELRELRIRLDAMQQTINENHQQQQQQQQQQQ